MSRRFWALTWLLAALLVPAGGSAQPASAVVAYTDQGSLWTDTARHAFYCRGQGSQLMELDWLLALERPDGTPFLKNDLGEYAYLSGDVCGTGLPLGFTSSKYQSKQWVGMTCAACHTRQISNDGRTYRIDGGPALVDFQALLVDIDDAVATTLNDAARFDRFATKVLRAPTPVQTVALRNDVQFWHGRFHALIDRALPKTVPWGLGRLDAVGMIFNRLTGLDIDGGKVVEDNIREANAPARYPFLWNASYQSRTQWPGFARNGNDVFALVRNVGEVLGVFGHFQPKRVGRTWRLDNSIDVKGLQALETSIKKIGPPAWPWSIDEGLAREGEAVFSTPTGGHPSCLECHGAKQSERDMATPRRQGRVRLLTSLYEVESDPKEYENLGRMAYSKVLDGASLLIFPAIKSCDSAFNILRFSVAGTILQNSFASRRTMSSADVLQRAEAGGASTSADVPRLTQSFAFYPDTQTRLKPSTMDLFPRAARRGSVAKSGAACEDVPNTGPVRYEARVLEGVWAAAPYLHNGSIATLKELLTAPADRVAAFAVGPNYDAETVGLSKDQPVGSADRVASNAGNSNQGHAFGTGLDAHRKRALIEFLKKL